jgi:hypothetical protein
LAGVEEKRENRKQAYAWTPQRRNLALPIRLDGVFRSAIARSRYCEAFRMAMAALACRWP